MLKRILMIALALTALGWNTRSAQAKVLALGDPSPALTVKKFVKGAPVAGFVKGKLYVVEFWATWCGPCKESIPHLTQLQKKFKDVTFIGVSVLERDPAKVDPFVKEMGDKMAYRVAIDDVPAGATADKGKMAVNWMEAAQQSGIPTAFVIDKESRIAWIGHPMAMEEPLGKIVAGNWDLKTVAAKAQRDQVLNARLQALNGKLLPPMKAKDYARALTIVDEALKSNPELEETIAPFKFDLLQNRLNNPDAAAAYGNKLVDGALKDNVRVLSAMAANVVNPDRPSKAAPVLVTMAVKAATRADDLARSKNPAVAAILAAAYFDQGKVAKAVETEERAVKLAKGTQLEAELNKYLITYRQAKK